MKDATAIHPLALGNTKSGRIHFVCFTDGQEHTFSTCVNRMSGDRLSWFDGDAPRFDPGGKWAKTVFADIRKKATKVLEVVGDY